MAKSKENKTEQFTGTRAAFKNLIQKTKWYEGLNVNGKAITTTNASQIKLRFFGKAKGTVSLDYMEDVLKAAGFNVAQQIVWEK